jgi:hypothetical protein
VLHYIRLDKVAGTNSLANWTLSKVTKKIKRCEYTTSVEPRSEGRLLALPPSNIIQGWKQLALTNTLAFYDAELITTVKSFIA